MSKYIALAAAVTVAALLIVHAQDANGIKFRTDARAQDSEAANLIRLGEEAAKRGQYEQADTLYAKAASLGERPEITPALLYLGIRALGSGNRLAAEGFFERLLRIDPKGPQAGPALSWLGTMRLQDPAEAESLYKQALEIEKPGSLDAADTVRNYTALMRRLGRLDEATALEVQTREARSAAAPAPPAQPRALPAGVYRVGDGITAPKLLSKTEPQYTEEARAAKIQGTTILMVEIGPDGLARNLEVNRSLEPGLDQKAIEAVQQWHFSPATKDGAPVTVQATIEVGWRLQ